MNTRNVSITSKNQITLPIEYVRSMHLERNRVLQAELREGTIVLTPQPTLGDTMRQFWGKHSVKKPLTDEEIKEAVRSSSVERLTKNT